MSTGTCQVPNDPRNIPSIVIEDFEATDRSFNADDQLEEILEELEDPDEPMEPVERAAIENFAESRQKKKYVFDGQNLFRFTPEKSEKLKAVVGKAFWLHRKIREKLTVLRPSVLRHPLSQGVFSGALADYLPRGGSQEWRVPPLIYHTVREIDSREPVTRAWIYQTPGCTRQINKVKRRFMRGTVPNLTKYDVHVLAGAITEMLSELKEPLIPRGMWKQFVGVVVNVCRMEERGRRMKQLIAELPEENRFTLGFLVRHLQDLARCRSSKLNLSGAAVIFAPLVLDYSCSENAEEEREVVIEVMLTLLKMDSRFFSECQL